KLKAGQHLDYASEKTVNLTVTATDAGGLSTQKTFTLSVQDDSNYPTPQPQPQPNRLGTVEISGVAKVGETLLATVSDADGVPNTVAYKWFADGQEIAGAAAATFKLTNAEKDKAITVQALYTDARGTAEQPLSAATDKVADTTAPGANGAGKVAIAGTAKVGQTLTAAVTDPDGVPDKVEYQWFADGAAIRGATGSSYILTDAEKYKVISVSARYTDLAGHAESVKGDIAPGDINTSISPDFLARQAQYKDLINSAAHKYDIDKALIHAIISVESAYQQEHIAPTNGAIGLMQLAPATAQMLGVNPHNAAENVDGGVRYFKTQLDRFHDVNLALAAYYDGPQTVEKHGNQVPPFASTKRYLDRVHGYEDIYQNERPELINDLGTLRVSGEAKIGANLAAEISDYDGVDPAKVQYQWRRDGKAIDGATGKTYTLQAADAGKNITLHAEYQDDRGVKETLDSSAITPPPANNHAPTGSVTISGTAKVGQTLTASNDLQDADGMGAITYHWFADGTEIGQGATYQIRATDKGKSITVKAEYTDGQAHAESVASQPTAAVSEDAPNQPGSVNITGEAKIGGILTAQVADGDGVDPAQVQYQWQRDGQPISGATGKTYTLKAEDVGHKISVQATYDDQAAHHETPTSPATDIAAADPHAGAITVTGAAKVGAVLTTAITDADGVPKTGIHYQWYADGKAIEGATHEVYRIRPGDIGKHISVQANYTDNGGHAETTNTAAVAQNVADNPATQSAHGHKLYAHEEFGKYIDARDFGVNPANADNTAALKAALKAADDEGAALYLGAGTLKLHEQIRIGADVHDKSGKLIQEGYENVRAIFGAGAGETHLTFDWQQTEGERFYPRAKDDRFNPWNNRTNVNPYAAILIDGVNGKSVADLSLEYQHKTAEDFYQKTKSYFGLINGIIVNDADHTKIDTVEISGMNRAGVYFTSTLAESSGARDKLKTHQISEADAPTGDNNQLVYSNLHHNRVAGALVAFQKNFTADSNHLAWNGHEADGGTGYGIASMAGSYGFGITYSRNTTDHNYRKGLDIHDGNHITIENNTLNGDRLYGIGVYNRQFTMDDVTIRNNHITADPKFRLATDDGDEIAGGTPNYHLYSGIQIQTNTQPLIQDLQSKGPGKFDISDNTISGLEIYQNGVQTYGIEFRNHEPTMNYALNIRGNHISGESSKYLIGILNQTQHKNGSVGAGSGDITIENNTMELARSGRDTAPIYLEEKGQISTLRGSVKINHNALTLREASEGATEAIAMHGNAKTYDVGHNTFELHGNVHDRPVVRINGSSSSAKPHLNLHDNTFQTEDHFDASWLKYGNASIETHNNTLNGKALVTAGSPYQHETPQLLHAHDGYHLNAETALHYPLPAAQPAKHAPYDSLETDKLHELLETHGNEHHAAPAHAPYDSLEANKLHELLGAHGGTNHEHGAAAKTATPHYDATHHHNPVSHLPQEDPYTIL
ncbi:transglycosylase SLT domain-containing protein, partial [Cardiobacterium hominis]